MKTSKPKPAQSLLFSTLKLTAPALALVLLGESSPAQGNDNRAPSVPATIQAQDGNKVHFHAYAIGVQIYHWNATLATWGASTPEAVLLDSDGNVVGKHYAGPTWEANSGSFVKGARIAGVTVDTTAIPWLLLGRTTNSPSGIFANITYIQRVNTVGGLAPHDPGTSNGQEFRSPYTAEYFFYREQ